MRTYNEKEVMQIVNACCIEQKKESLKVFTNLMEDDSITQQQADESMADYLSNNIGVEVSFENINEYLNDK